MKKLLLSTFVLFAFANTFSQNTSNLIVFSEGGERFYLILNGIRQNDLPQTNVKVEGLNAANYSTKIIFEDKTIPELTKKYLTVQDADGNVTEATYAIKEKKGQFKLRWRSAVPLNQAPAYTGETIVYTTVAKPAIETVVVNQTTTTTTSGNNSDGININMNVGATNMGAASTQTSTTTTNSNVTGTTSTTTTTTQTGGTGESVGVNVNLGGMNMGVGININDGDMTQSSTTTTTTVTSSSSTTAPTNGGTVVVVNETASTQAMPGYTGVVGCNGWPMTENDFSQSKTSIESKSFSDSKLKLAKQVAGSNCLTAQQVKEITSLFDFESTRLEFAKYAYSRTYDIGNYFKVNDAFEFESSIDELDSYINGLR